MPVYNVFHESRVNMKALNACREEEIDTLCDQLSVPFIYRLKLRGGLNDYKKALKKKEAEGTYVIEKAEKIALTNLQEKQELAKRLLKAIPKHLKGEFQTFFVCVWVTVSMIAFGCGTTALACPLVHGCTLPVACPTLS